MPIFCRRTVQRHLKAVGIQKWVAVTHPALLEQSKRLQSEWAQDHKYLTLEDQDNVVWSDEVSVEKHDGKGIVQVFRNSHEKYSQDCIEPKDDGTKALVMFQGCFAGSQKGGFVML